MALSGVFCPPPSPDPLQRRSTLDSPGALNPSPLLNHIVPKLESPSSYTHAVDIPAKIYPFNTTIFILYRIATTIVRITTKQG